MGRKVEIELEFQNYIPYLPVPAQALRNQATASDTPTIERWKTTWIGNYIENQKRFGPFKDKHIGKFFGHFKHKPVIIAGSGPSLKHNGLALKDRGGVGLVSCLHNFHFMEDNEIPVDFYVTLDAGDVTIEEVAEGGKRDANTYWQLTKGKTLFAYCGTSPRLLEKWQGDVYFYNCPIGDDEIMTKTTECEPFTVYIGTGGNVLGACMYISKAFFGASMIAFAGADFSFGYNNKFHPWDSKYDATLGQTVSHTDVFGNRVKTWQSYANFKAYFEWVVNTIPGLYINCTEGGIFGSYADGNIMHLRQMELSKFLTMLNMHEEIREQAEDPHTIVRKLLF